MKKLLILAGIVAITCSTQAFAQENAVQDTVNNQAQIECPEQKQQCKVMQKKQCKLQKFEEELNLTTKQKEQLKELREKQKAEAEPLVQQIKQKENEIKELRGQLRDLREQNKKDFEAILTDKQLKKLNELRAERKAKCMKHHKRHGHRPAPQPCNCTK